jgi:hypothetical protein
MIVKRVTGVHLSHHPEAGDNSWLVEWTTATNTGKTHDLRATACTEASARQLARNLVEMRVDGLSIEDVYSQAV